MSRILRCAMHIFGLALGLSLFSACDQSHNDVADRLNEQSYAWHYRNLDSTRVYAERALQASSHYSTGRAEALNNLAFVEMARMKYHDAALHLQRIDSITDNQFELLIADIQQMKLCQKESRNKDFYEFKDRAQRRLQRIGEDKFSLTAHQQARLAYAQTEYSIVSSTYYYYVGLMKQAVGVMDGIDPYGLIQRDTAQLLNYWYYIGSGGVIHGSTPDETAQQELDYLGQCYQMARQYDYPYWEAQALQAISEHLNVRSQRETLLKNNYAFFEYLNVDMMPDSLLAGNLALRALQIFTDYGDVYQQAGAYRTLAESYWEIGDYSSALICLKKALGNNPAIGQAPDLVASIREQLSLVYSAANDKVSSDRNRNIYLDLQEQTRQDRMLEARVSQLSQSSRLLNVMIVVVAVMIVVVILLLWLFNRMRRRTDERFRLTHLLKPLQQWRSRNEEANRKAEEAREEINEETDVTKLHLQQDRRRNLEQRAKVQLANSILPLIDRMLNEVRRLKRGDDSKGLRQQRYQYIAELTDNINADNDVLTRWIQMRQGEVGVKVENFSLQSLFNIVDHGRMSFRLKGIDLIVKPTDAVVKADRTLTLFMINTIADNARRFTPSGGSVTVSAEEAPDYVEISITDTGSGMSPETLAHIFDRTFTGGHGFGLKNCNGIIEKYRKMSRIFHVCLIKAESQLGKGTRIFFRLPLGKLRYVLLLLFGFFATLSFGHPAAQAQTAPASPSARMAQAFADSAYQCNLDGRYAQTLVFADSCHKYLTQRDTTTLLDISNEAAVAALALHRWDVYHRNNNVYTRLFREASADSSLPDYARAMQRSEANKTVAVILLVVLLLIIFPAYYFLYYRHILNYRFCINRIGKMNELLLSDISDEEKLKGIERLKDFRVFSLSQQQVESLNRIVGQIEEALSHSIDNRLHQATETEFARDELHRLQLEDDRLHVSNSILDNCLSTLKHETMYYPSQIKLLLSGKDANLDAIDEVTRYYHELYVILSDQATRQILPMRIDQDTVDYLFEVLKRVNGGVQPERKVSTDQSQYAHVSVRMSECKYPADQVAQLFTPATPDVDFLLCRQIVREMGEVTNLRACGISALTDHDGTIVVNIIMPARYAATLKPAATASETTNTQ